MPPSISHPPAESRQMDLLEKVKTARAAKGLRDTSASDLVANLIEEEARRMKLLPACVPHCTGSPEEE